MIAAIVLSALTASGSAQHPVTTRDPKAQALFNRGLTMLYSYNGDAARAAFAAALQRDPQLAMAAWGQALAAGTDLNTPLDEDRFARAQAAAKRAQSLAGSASEEERAYIAAVSQRYAGTYADRDADEARYRTAMAQLVAQYPTDDDAAMLDAEALMEHLGTEGMWTAPDRSLPTPDAATAIDLIERVLSRNPTHLMANHLCMHAYDFARDRAPALPCAARMTSWTLEPAQEHLAHMPAHTYLETGAYAQAMAADERAWRLREQWNARPEPFQLKYAEHDSYSGWSAAMMLGNLLSAQTWAARVGEAYHGSDLWATWARFGRWDWIAHSSAQNEFYAPLARGLTDVHLGVMNDARSMLALYGNLDTDYRWLLKAAVDERDGRVNDAIAALNRAIAYQDREFGAETLPLFPAGESLGQVYYRAGRFTEARDAFQATLAEYPNDPRALYGLALAQQKLGDTAGSTATLKAFNAVWKEADPPDFAL